MGTVLKMVRPVVYSPKKAFALSKDDIAKYKEIAAAVSKKGAGADAKAAVQKSQAALALVAQDVATQSYDDAIDTKDSQFEGVVLGGPGGGGVVSGGDLKVSDDVYLEEPRVVADEDDEESEERSLWGDGDNDPAEADA